MEFSAEEVAVMKQKIQVLYEEREHATRDQDRCYWEVQRNLKLLFGDIIPTDFNEFVKWIEEKICHS